MEKVLNKTVSLDIVAFAFIIGCLPLLILPRLLTLYEYMLGIIFILFLFYCIQQIALKSICKNIIAFILIIIFSFMWSSFLANIYLKRFVPYIDTEITQKVTINSVNLWNNELTALPKYVTFTITDTSSNKINISAIWPLKFQSAYAGQVWLLNLKIRSVHSQLNEGGFDRQRWAMSQRQMLQASIKQAELIEPVQTLRQKIVTNFLSHVQQLLYHDIIIALVFGERGRLSEPNQITLFRTGTAHLIAISGMHISLIAWFGWCFARGIQWILPTAFISPLFPLLLSWIVAAMYSWLAGMNPPVMRAMVALTIVYILRISSQKTSNWQILFYVITLLLIYDPLMILSDSFWLSCYAVICLLFWTQWFPFVLKTQSKSLRYFLQLCYLQLGMMLLLLPIQCLIFHGVSYSAIFANLIAIPVISFIVLPLILLALLTHFLEFQFIVDVFITAADFSLFCLFEVLKQFNDYWLAISNYYLIISFIGWVLLIMWRTSLWRNYFATVFIIVILIASFFRNRQTELWRLDMLDVGHGLAIVIQQNKKAILYDTGDQGWSRTVAETIILPFLRWHDLKLEGIILSHNDSDHSGGLTFLKSVYPESWLASSSKIMLPEIPCKQGYNWQWQQLNFYVLWPTDLVNTEAKNNHSCVIRLSHNQYSVLLTGDLERSQEYQLIEKYRNKLPVTIMQIPHHGSNTSSTYPFIYHTNTTIVINSVARYSPWSLPSINVIKRYNQLDIPIYSTHQSGQISIEFYLDKYLVKTYREKIKPRWYHDWFGALDK